MSLLNHSRTDQFMTKLGLDAMIATSAVNVSYLTGGFDCHTYHMFKEYQIAIGSTNRPAKSFALFTLDKPPTLVTATENLSYSLGLELDSIVAYGETPLDIRSKPAFTGDREMDRILELHNSPAKKTAIEGLLESVRERQLENSTIGIEYDTMDSESITFIKNKLPNSKIGDCTEVLRLIRMVKTSSELEQMKMAANVNEKTLNACMNAVKPGVAWGEVRQVYRESIAEGGALPTQFLYAVNGFDITDYDGSHVKSGDIGFIDVVCTYNRYYSDTGQSFMVGKRNGQSLDTYAKLSNQLDRVGDQLRPGVGSKEIFKQIGILAGKIGVKFIQHGHSLGLEPREHPIIMELPYDRIADDFVNIDSDIPLEENMVVNIETPYYNLELGSFILERSFVITKDGSEGLAIQKRDEPYFR